MAAMLVVLYHYTAWHHEFWNGTQAKEAWPDLSRVTMFGNMGVQLFFIISGFVILLSSYGKDIPAFVGSRIGRLFPAYWVAVIVSGILVLFIWPAMGEGRTIVDWMVNLTMLQQGFGIPHMDGVYWTLWAELRFYVWIAALMLLRCMTPLRLLAFTMLWPLAVIATSGIHANWREQMLVPEYAPLFAGGMVLFLIYRFGHTPARWLVLGFNVVFAAYQTGAGASRDAAELVGYAVPAWVYWMIVVALFAAIALISLTRLGHVSLPGLALAGALTYPVYLLHEVWGWWLIKQLSPILDPYAVLLIVLGVVLTAAYLVYRFVELRWGRKLSKATAAGLRRITVSLTGFLGGTSERLHRERS
ncbi:acyltransferase [Paeniglutamicibacter cryotolerans]